MEGRVGEGEVQGVADSPPPKKKKFKPQVLSFYRPLELILFEESLASGPSAGKSWSPKDPVCTECLLSKG
jgi:hypothetical protein